MGGGDGVDEETPFTHCKGILPTLHCTYEVISRNKNELRCFYCLKVIMIKRVDNW